MPGHSLHFESVFNRRVFGDIVFFLDSMFLIMVDEPTRFTRIWALDLKTLEAMEHAVRRCWIALFGPMRKFTIDAERAMALDRFGCWC